MLKWQPAVDCDVTDHGIYKDFDLFDKVRRLNEDINLIKPEQLREGFIDQVSSRSYLL